MVMVISKRFISFLYWGKLIINTHSGDLKGSSCVMVSLVSKKVLRMIEMDFSDLRVRLNMLGVFPKCHAICPSFVANSCELFVNTCHVLSKIISAPFFQMGQWALFDRTLESPSRSVPRVAGENTEVFHKI